MLRMAVIGYGMRISGIADMIRNFKAGAELVAVADPQTDVVAAKLKTNNLKELKKS